MDGTLQRWNISKENPRVTYEIKTDAQGFDTIYRDLVESAALLWSNVPNAYIQIDQIQATEKAQITFHFEESVGENSHSAGYATFDEFDGEKPKHCSIYIPTGQSASLEDFSKTILHEFGHCLGLGHSVIPQSIMSYSLDRNAFALDVDDEAAVSRIYPAKDDNEKLNTGCAIAKNSRGGKARWLALLLLPLILFLGKRMDV